MELIETVTAAQRGDLAAFDELVRHFRNSIMAYAYSVLQDFHLAQDVAQETLVSAFFSLPRLKEPAAFASWLQSIARHECHRLLRRRDMELVPMEMFQTLTDAGNLPLERAEEEEVRGAIASLIDALSPLDREITRLFYLEGCSQREAAAFLKLPLTTINNRLHIAKRIMRERINAMPSITPSGQKEKSNQIGEIVRIDGPIIDAHFAGGQMPDIFDALLVADAGGQAVEKMKVAQRRENGIARCIATGPIAALKPGMKVMNSGEVGVGLTPRVAVAPMVDVDVARAIDSFPQPTAPRLLETGIKPIDLLCPLTTGGSLGLFGTQGVGRIVLVEELIRRLRESAGLRIFYLVEPNEPDSVRGMLTEEKEYPGDVVGSVQVMWLLTESATDPDFAAGTELFDTAIYCSPIIGIQGLYPAIDPLLSRSRLLVPQIVGQEHFDVAERVRDVLQSARKLMTDPLLLELLACRARHKARQRVESFPRQRLGELAAEDRLLVARARKLERYLTTPFFVAEPFSHQPGQSVPLAQTIHDCRDILDGIHDARKEEELVYIGEIAQVA